MRPSISPYLPLGLLLLFSLLNLTSAAKSTAISFCKCICFNNSTIIALNPPNSKSSSHRFEVRSSDHHSLEGTSPARSPREAQEEEKAPSKPHHKLSCADCTRAFCLDYNLPICKDAKDEDVFTTCFQRDSLKDETVVVIFIIATAGLLAWALVKPWVERVRQRNERREFPPLVGSQGNSNRAAGHDATSPRNQGSSRGGASSSVRGGGRGGVGRSATDARFLDADEDAVDIGSGSALGAAR
ncbi:hypothetical protein LTR84_012788 [Exophiala bonariae]|uniref:Uncharacterized protein n=1 Tax=Exophiala bonariae TaxID=1690606 RepID=A0AAV9NFE6_9EURO|nr:hypothetical protein LTR84_012788 [Exophiala bonariae]